MRIFKYLLLSLGAVVVVTFGAILAAIWTSDAVTGPNPYSTPSSPKRDTEELKTACKQHVREADRKANDAIAKRSQAFAEFIKSKKPGAKPFSKKIVTLYGKWRAVKPYLPFTREHGHEEFIAYEFGQSIFSEAELASAIKLSIEGSIKDIESIENELAVALRQEILGRSLAPNEIPIAAGEFKKAVSQMVTAAQVDAAKTAASLVASEVASSVATQVMIRLGVSAGILTAGTASSPWTLGAGFVVGAIVDLVWGWIDNPEGDIEREMNTALDSLARQGSTAIEQELNKVVSQRSGLWNKTIEEIVP